MPPQVFHGMALQDGAMPFDTQLQGPVIFVDATGQQHGTSVTFHPQLQAPLVTMDGAGLQYGTPVPYSAQLQAPIMCVDAPRQQYITATPFSPQLQAPFMFVEGGGLLHGTTLPSDPYVQVPLVPMDVTGLQPGTTFPLNPVTEPIPVHEPVQFFGAPQLPSIQQLAAEPSSTGLMKPAEVVKLPAQQRQQESKDPMEVAECAPSYETTETPRPQLTTSTMVAEKAMKVQGGQPKATTVLQVPDASSSKDSQVDNPNGLDDTMKKELHRAMEDTEVQLADKSASPKRAPKTASLQVGKADAKLPKKTKDRQPESNNKGKDKRKRRKNDKGEEEGKAKRLKETSPTEKSTKSGDSEKEGPDASEEAEGSMVTGEQSKAKHKDSKKSSSKKAKDMATTLQPRSKLGERMMHSVKVFHKLGEKLEKVKAPKSSPEESAQTSQSELPSSSGGQREQPRIPFPVQPYRIPKVKRPSTVSDQPRSSNAPDQAPVLSDAQQPHHPAAPSQSRPLAPGSDRKVWRPPTHAHHRHPHEVPHYYKNHAHGSVGNYGDGERIVYMKPEYPGMFPLPLICLPPLPPGAPRRFHCREYSVTITAERRAEREAMKREAQRNREEAAKITRGDVNCTVLADRKHLPHEPWPREDNWWETGLDEVWKYDECMEGLRDDLDID